jgi:broad specificity phosphatase PhoE
LGRAQAAYCSERLAELVGGEESVVLSSPMERCLDTAGIIVSNLENCEGVRIVPELCESFGDYNLPKGYKPASLREKAEARGCVVGEYDDGVWWSMESEDRESLAIRMAMFRNRLLGVEFDGRVVVCVGHWPTIAALARSMTPEAAMRKVDNAAITKIVYDENNFKLELLNAYVYGTD